jgi:single-strand DNA-binding protein
MSVNKVILVGRLGKDPELKYTPSGTAVVGFTLATDERYKDKEGNPQTKTEWHNIVAWRQLAEICGKFLHKGKQVYIEGKIQTRSYDDRDGNKKYITEIVADQMQMLGNKDDSQQASGQQSQPQQSQQRPQQQSRPPEQTQGGSFGEPAFDQDTEIPF